MMLTKMAISPNKISWLFMSSQQREMKALSGVIFKLSASEMTLRI